jgi:LCCL domain
MGASTSVRSRFWRVLACLATVGLAAIVVACKPSDLFPEPSSLAGADGDPWAAQAMQHRGANGRVVPYDCPADGVLGDVWGTIVYTDDSSVCTAAVHMGLITRAAGGTVRIAIQPGRVSYAGTSQNGVTTQRWDRWDGSFVFVAR